MMQGGRARLTLERRTGGTNRWRLVIDQQKRRVESKIFNPPLEVPPSFLHMSPHPASIDHAPFPLFRPPITASTLPRPPSAGRSGRRPAAMACPWATLAACAGTGPWPAISVCVRVRVSCRSRLVGRSIDRVSVSQSGGDTRRSGARGMKKRLSDTDRSIVRTW